MIKSLLLIAASISIGVVGQLCLKAGMGQVGRVGAQGLSQPVQLLLSMLSEPLVLLALPLYALGFFIWAVVLSRLSLSFAYPLLAATYILTPLAASLVFGEQVSAVRWAGMVVIFVGVAIVGSS